MERDIVCTGCSAEMGGYAVGVRVQEGESSLDYDVTLSQVDLERLGRPGETPEAFVIRCFEFLLEREPKESILRSFDVTVIGTYFPEFEEQIAGW